MLLCYQMAALRNKQVGGAKTAIGLFMADAAHQPLTIPFQIWA
jgi:hypothetical protein